jgi:hypothetical protein
MTVGFKSEQYKTIIEFPIDAEKNFLILNFALLDEDGKRYYVRKIFEIYRNKKLKILMN